MGELKQWHLKQWQERQRNIAPAPDPRLCEMIVNAELRLQARIDEVMDDIAEVRASAAALVVPYIVYLVVEEVDCIGRTIHWASFNQNAAEEMATTLYKECKSNGRGCDGMFVTAIPVEGEVLRGSMREYDEGKLLHSERAPVFRVEDDE